MTSATSPFPTQPSSNAAVVSCEGVLKSYGSGPTSVSALRGIDLAVQRGELLMIVGPSGCGKTTLISIISTMLRPDAGRCSVLGRDLASLSEVERALFRREKIGFVFQLFNLLPTLTAAENVAVPLLIAGESRSRAQSRAAQALEDVGLTARASALPRELSGGEQQRVAIARAIVHDPPLVVCDEPTSSLDHETGQAVMETLRATNRLSGRTLLVVTHDPRIFGFADRIARMDDGRIADIAESAGRP